MLHVTQFLRFISWRLTGTGGNYEGVDGRNTCAHDEGKQGVALADREDIRVVDEAAIDDVPAGEGIVQEVC